MEAETTEVTKRHPNGRPTLYRPEYIEIARRLCEEENATDADLAKAFGVTVRTIERWRVAHPDFCRAVQDAKDNADDRVEAALYDKAVGFERTVQRASNGKVLEFKEYFAPDTAAAFIWLKNRRSQKWKDRNQLDVNHTVTLSQAFEKFLVGIEREDAPLTIEHDPSVLDIDSGNDEQE
jgi:hypothetical protein